MVDVDADDRAGHDRGNVMIGPVSAAAEPGMQIMPRGCAHRPITWVGADRVLGVTFFSGGGVFSGDDDGFLG